MTDTSKRNEEIANECFLTTEDETCKAIIEALNTKDREKDEAVREAVERERGRIKDILCLLPCASHGGVLPNGKIPAAILVSDIFAVLKEGLQDSNK